MSTRLPASGMRRKVPALDAQSARYHAPRTQLILAWSGETVRSLRSVSAQRTDEPIGSEDAPRFDHVTHPDLHIGGWER